MAQLAIKGHPTRGKEVIEILEMLGGKNKLGLFAKNETLVYFIKNGVINNTCMNPQTLPFKTFTLEEFLEKFPYKVGDKVIVKTLPEYPKTIKFMEWFDNSIYYSFDKETWFEADGIQLYKEKETMEERKYADLRLDVDQDDKLATEATINGNKITPPENYLIGKITQVDNGLLVEFVKKQPQLPKTYVECCEILYPNENFQLIALPLKGHSGKKLFALQKLLVCRDAYWKLAGEQMKLGQSWEPNWNSGDQERYGIIKLDDNGYQYAESTSFVFSTEEMRDAFYENFKKLIEQCKELL